MVENPYFQFPLCALAYGQTVDARLNTTISYATVEAGLKLWRKLSPEQQKGRMVGFRAWEAIPEGARWNSPYHCAVLYAADVLGTRLGHFPSRMSQHAELREYITAFESRHGPDARVRLKISWFFDARDGHGLTYREFSVLCAIYSAIGDKELAIITRDRIRRCALGYRTTAIMQAELSTRADKGQPLTERQLRDTITRLHRNKFFARCTVARRITYYSIRLDSEALRNKVLERRTYPDYFHASQSALDQVLTTAIEQKRREAAKSEPKAPPATPRFKFTLPGQNS